MIATGSEDGTIKLWSQANDFAKPLWTASGFARGSAAVLDQGPAIAQGQLRAERLHDDFEPNITHVAFSSDPKHLLATSATDRSISSGS
ncbi:hypothetical protein B5V01_08155 [Mesorhizobium erdmanii]|uniref:Uncharacterized protein n=2 Tax=Mesorhizobium TaxID=68287 RepID=A0A3M9X3A4_9HYPH|nr:MULTISPECIES: hypothetical protein [Mesorhizobium]RNJ42393.1 hypothetical protein DNR46_28770 [Mesorhizobium japonicum]RXT47925.1 hypothetical protein B5V01_08155 [Mesorhizobium erdmanii]